MKERIYCLTFTAILLLYCIIAANEEIIHYGHILYLTQFLFLSFLLYRKSSNYFYFLSPSFLSLAYLSIYFWLGHYTVSRGLGINLAYYHIFYNVKSISFITGYLILCNSIVFLSIPFKRWTQAVDNRNTINSVKQKENIKKPRKFVVPVLVLLFLALTEISIDLTSLGGAGDFSYVLKFTLFIIIIFYISQSKNSLKWIVYLLLIIMLMFKHFDSKREIFYSFIAIGFFELFWHEIKIKFKLKTILLITAIGVVFFVIVAASSITRGYGNYNNVENPIEAITHVEDYVTSDLFASTAVSNFELTTVYGNTINAIDYVNKEEVELLYGSTFLKVLFIPFPRNIFPAKPRSMIDIYTTKFAPSFRSIGGSYPVTIYGECYWNFGTFGVLFIFMLFYLFNRAYEYMVVLLIINKRLTVLSVFLLYLYTTIIQFIRGSGLDMWFVYALIAFPFIMIIIPLINTHIITPQRK